MQQLAHEESLEGLVAGSSVLLLEFGSRTCAPCAALRRRADAWLADHPDVVGRYVPVEEFREESAQFGVLSAPAMRAYVGGLLVASDQGYFSLDLLLERLERAMALAFG